MRNGRLYFVEKLKLRCESSQSNFIYCPTKESNGDYWLLYTGSVTEIKIRNPDPSKHKFMISAANEERKSDVDSPVVRNSSLYFRFVTGYE